MTQGVDTVKRIKSTESLTCQHDGCNMKFNSLEERSCHEKVHQKFKDFSKSVEGSAVVRTLDKEAQDIEVELKKKKIEDKRKHEDTHDISDSRAKRKRRPKKIHCTFGCSRCSKMFKYEDSLFEHMNAVHFKIRKPYECSECVGDGRLGPAVFISRKQLIDHLREIHSMRIRQIRYNFKNESVVFEYETFVYCCST